VSTERVVDRESLHRAITKRLFEIAGTDGDMAAQDWEEGDTDLVLAALQSVAPVKPKGRVNRAADGRWYVGTADMESHPDFATEAEARAYLDDYTGQSVAPVKEPDR